MTNPVDIIWNMTAVCPHDCATCCVDAVHAAREGSEVRIRSHGLERTTRLARPDRSQSIYDVAARHLQARGLELSLREKRAVLDNIDVDGVRLDISGGDPLVVSENLDVLRLASEKFGRANITLTATGAGLAGVDLAEVASLIGEYNFTFDSAAATDVAHRPKQYAARNFQVARQFAALGVTTRAEFPITRSTSSADHVARLYRLLHAAGVDKLLLMRLFPVGRGAQISHETLTAAEYRAVIRRLRDLEAEHVTPVLKLQCALRLLDPTSRRQSGNPCDLVRESFGLMADGTLLMSPWAINSVGRPLDGWFDLGNLARQHLSEILQSPRVREVRARADENFGECKIFSFLNSTRSEPLERLLDRADPLYRRPTPAENAA